MVPGAECRYALTPSRRPSASVAPRTELIVPARERTAQQEKPDISVRSNPRLTCGTRHRDGIVATPATAGRGSDRSQFTAVGLLQGGNHSKSHSFELRWVMHARPLENIGGMHDEKQGLDHISRAAGGHRHGLRPRRHGSPESRRLAAGSKSGAARAGPAQGRAAGAATEGQTVAGSGATQGAISAINDRPDPPRRGTEPRAGPEPT